MSIINPRAEVVVAEVKICMKASGEITATWPARAADAIFMLEIAKQMILNPQSRKVIEEPGAVH